jgi:hypothetical protein
MASYPASSSFSSLQQLLAALATLITEVSHRQENAWVLNTELNRLFCDKYGESIDTALNAQVSGSELRNLLCHYRSPRFRVHETSNPKEFYIALLDETVPGGVAESVTTIQYRVKRPWKVDGRLTRMLKSEGAQELPSRWSQPARWRRERSKVQPTPVKAIQSKADFEAALISITQILITSENPVKMVTLCHKFCAYYGPIRLVRRRVCPDIKLVDYLQTIPALDVQAVDGHWQITLNDRLKP